MLKKISSSIFTASETLTNAAIAFTAMGAFFHEFAPQTPTRVGKAFSITSAAVTSLFYLASRGPANFNIDDTALTEDLKQNKIIMTLSAVALIGATVGGWYAVSTLLAELISNPLIYELLALLPAILNLRSFTSYNLNFALENLKLFHNLYQSGEISLKNAVFTLTIISFVALGYSMFNFFLVDNAFLTIIPKRNYRDALSLSLTVILSIGTFLATLAGPSGSLATVISDSDDIDLRKELATKSSNYKKAFISLMTPINLYEFCSTIMGYTIAAEVSFNKIGFKPTSTFLTLLKYIIEGLIALISASTDAIFTQRQAMHEIIKLLPEKKIEETPLVHRALRKRGFFAKVLPCCTHKSDVKFQTNAVNYQI